MFAQTSILLLLSCSASTLAQLSLSPVAPTVTGGTTVVDGITVSPSQVTQIAEDLYSLLKAESANFVPVVSQVVNALTKEGYPVSKILGDLEGAVTGLIPTDTIAALVTEATESPQVNTLPFETALPSEVKNNYDALELGVYCKQRDIIRSDLNLPSDAVATQCAAIISSASAAVQAARTASTGGGVALARPTGISGLAGGMIAAGMVGAAAVLL